jgi:Protein of unknown function (DUF3562)
MNPLFELDKEAVRQERAVTSLCDRTGAPPAEVRSLFTQEFARLELNARVRSYLAVLTESNVRAMLRRKGSGRPPGATRRRQLDRGDSPRRDGLLHEHLAA